MRLAPGAALIGVVVATLATIAPAVAVTATPGESLRPTGDISLATQTAWVDADGAFAMGIDLSGVQRPEALELVVTVHEAVRSRSQFRQTLDGDLLGDPVWRRPPAPLPSIELDSAGAIPVTIQLRDPGAAFDPARPALAGPGVHPVRVELREVDGGEVVDAFTTHLVRTRDDDAAPLAVAWVQPFDARPAVRPDGSVGLDAADADALVDTSRVLASTSAPLTLVPTPETLGALGAVRPEALDQLRQALPGRQVVAGPYVDIDTVALVDAGLGQEVVAQRRRGAEVVADALGVDPDARTRVADGDDLAPEAFTDIDRLVAPEEALAPLDRPLTLANPFLVGGSDGRLIEAAAVDPGLSADLTGTDDPVLAAHHLLADLAVLAYDSPGLERGVVVRPPPGRITPPELLATALGALGSGSVVRPVTLDQLFAEVPRATAGGDELVRSLRPVGEPNSELPAPDVRAVRDQVKSLNAMLADGEAPEEVEQLLLVATAEGLDLDERRAYLAGARQGIDERLGNIDILSSGSFRLTSREATIPLTLVNDLDAAMRVSLLLESDKLDFVGPGAATAGSAAIPLVLQPGNTPVVVPVEARTSGDFPLLITLRSPDGGLDVAQARLTVRSTFLSGVGIALSVGAGLFLCVWWARHWRTARRDRRLVAPPG